MNKFSCFAVTAKYLKFSTLSEHTDYLFLKVILPICWWQYMKCLVLSVLTLILNFNSCMPYTALLYGLKKSNSFVLFLKSICAVHSLLQMHWILHHFQCDLFITTLCVLSIVSEYHKKCTITPAPPQFPWSVIKHISIAELYVLFQFISKVLC